MALKLIITALLLALNLNAQIVPVLATNGPALLTTAAATDFPSQTTTKTLLTGLATTQEMHLRGRVPVGGYFTFTNISTGVGNSVAMRTGSGQYTILP